MPYSSEFIFNQLFLEHNGVRIFHTYRDNELGIPQQYEFGTAADTSNRKDDTLFNVEKLPTWVEPVHPPKMGSWNDSPEERLAKELARDQYREEKVEEKAIRVAIIAAIDGGHLQPYIDAARAEDRPQFITSYYDKEEKWKETDKETKKVTYQSISQIKAQLIGINETLIDQIKVCYNIITGDKMDFLRFDGYDVRYYSGAEYFVDGIQLKSDEATPSSFMMLEGLPGEDDDREDRDAQYLHHMSAQVLIEILTVVLQIQKDGLKRRD
jgi:hypothetical protein